LPVWIGKNESLRLLTDTVHDGGAVILAVLVAGHIAAALKHRFIDRDAVMQRMTTKPARRADPAATEPAKAM